MLDSYSTALVLHINDTNNSDNVDPLRHLSIVQAQCVTRGIATDSNALYLIELTDARGVLHNRWFSHPLNSAYNIRAPAYPSTDRGGTFYPATMNTGVSPTTTWTWSTMLQNIWEQMTLLGTWPGLPFTPDSAPEGYWFSGVPAWYALCDVLNHIGMGVVCDLTSDNPYTIVKLSAADSALTTLQTRFLPNLEDDLEWVDTGSGRTPSSVKVYFRRRNEVYGSEETVTRRNDHEAEQWSTEAVYSVTISAPSEFSTSAGVHHIWSDFTVRYDQTGTILAADATRASTIAQALVTNYFASIFQYMTQTYTGALPFKTGSLVDGVCWHMGSNAPYSAGDRSGWRTQIVRGPNPPWPEVYEDCK